jgi:hypothetical protein
VCHGGLPPLGVYLSVRARKPTTTCVFLLHRRRGVIARARVGGMPLATCRRMDDLERLRAKLCRELAQSERSADVHSRREARRLGDIPPSRALHALGEHARAQRQRFDAIANQRQPQTGLQIARAIGQVFSALRNLLFDRMIDSERSYRGTLLGFRHGVDTVRLLREVAVRLGDDRLVEFCDDWLPRRVELVTRAERQLAWFADVPSRALRSGTRVALGPR